MSFPAYEEYKDSGVEWLGDVPEHWETKCLRYVMTFSKGLTITKRNLQDEGVPCVNYGEIHSKYGFEVNPAVHALRCVASEYLDSDPDALLNDGDFVFADTSEDIEGSGNFTHVRSGNRLFAGYHTIIGRPGKEVIPLFLAFQLESDFVRSQIQRQVKGVKVFSVSQSILKNLKCWLPSLPEQRTIASFLDTETSKIDGLVSEQRRLIELLKEKRQAVISHAVTKGLNPDVKMKDSGVEWLGEVPEHWEVRRLKFLCDVQTGSRDTKDAVDDGEYPFFVRSQNIERITSMSFDCEAVLTAGDGAGVGKVFHHFQGAFDFHQRVYMMNNFRDISGRLFFHYLKENFYKVALEGGAKSTVDSLRRPMLTDFPVCVPPENEQSAIVELVEKVSTRFDALRVEAERAIELLQERRTALISAAVTGKIDVRGYKPEEAE